MKDTFAFLSTTLIVYTYFIIIGAIFAFYVLWCITKSAFISLWKLVKRPFTLKINKIKTTY